MRCVQNLDEIKSGDKSWAGEKAERLGELIRAGFEVPRGFCLSAQAYRDTFNAHQLYEKIAARLEQIEISDPAQLEQAAGEIRSWIEHTPLSNEITQEIQAALGEVTAASYAVRASRVVEDVPNPAGSGQQQAHLAVLSAGVLDAIRRCWATPWNSRAIYFRHRKRIAHTQVTMAVVVQTMVEAEASGVLFTASPLGARTDEIHIDAIWGLGEAVNAARWLPDHFIVDKSNGAIRGKNVTTKTVMDVAAPEGGVQTVGVEEEKQNTASLTDAQTVALAEIGKKIEAHFKTLADIEWCRFGDRFFILQTREMMNK